MLRFSPHTCPQSPFPSPRRRTAWKRASTGSFWARVGEKGGLLEAKKRSKPVSCVTSVLRTRRGFCEKGGVVLRAIKDKRGFHGICMSLWERDGDYSIYKPTLLHQMKCTRTDLVTVYSKRESHTRRRSWDYEEKRHWAYTMPCPYACVPVPRPLYIYKCALAHFCFHLHQHPWGYCSVVQCCKSTKRI